MPPFFSNKPHCLQFCFLLLFIVGGATIFSSFALVTVKLSGLEVGSRWYLYVAQSIGSFGMFFAPAVFFSYCVTKKWFSYSEADKIAPPHLVGYVLILSLLILPVVAGLGYLNEQITLPEFMQKMETWMRELEEKSKWALQMLTANSTIPILLLNIVVMAFFPALFEEFLFRGALQPLFTKWFVNKHVAIIVTALIFSAIHFQFYGFIPRFLLGIYLGYLLVWGKSLWLPVIAHFMHNALSLILDYAAQRRGIDLEAIEPSQMQGFYPVVLVCTLFVGVGIYYLQKSEP